MLVHVVQETTYRDDREQTEAVAAFEDRSAAEEFMREHLAERYGTDEFESIRFYRTTSTGLVVEGEDHSGGSRRLWLQSMPLVARQTP